MTEAILQPKVSLSEHLNLQPKGPDFLVPAFQSRHVLWGLGTCDVPPAPPSNNSALVLAAVMTSSPRETMLQDLYPCKPRMLIYPVKS